MPNYMESEAKKGDRVMRCGTPDLCNRALGEIFISAKHAENLSWICRVNAWAAAMAHVSRLVIQSQ